MRTTNTRTMCFPIIGVGAASLVALLLAAGTVVSTPQVASAAEPFAKTGLYATVQNSSNIVSVNRSTGATNTVLTAPNGAVGLNQIGVSGDGNTMFFTNGSNVYEYTTSTETWAVTPRGALSVSTAMGGVDPKTGNFFYGGQGGGGQFAFAQYNPKTNTVSASTVKVTATNSPGGQGDLAFDGQGNLYFVASGSTGAQVYRVNADQLAGGTTTATKVGPEIASTVSLNSMAFGDDGYLYIAGAGANGFLKVNPITADIVSRQTLNVSIADLGSNALPSTGSAAVTLPDGRFKDGDQFSVTLEGGGISADNTASTTGTETSAQVGPILLLPGGTYTVKQTLGSETNAEDYTTTWICSDPATGDSIADGTGNDGSFTIPEGIAAVSCVFTNTRIAAPTAASDTSKDNTPGDPVTVDVVNNDIGDVDPATMRLINEDGDHVQELAVPGEGTWAADPATGKITFTPSDGFTGNPAAVEYSVTDARGYDTTSTVTVTYLPTAADDASTGNKPGMPTIITPTSNDSTNVMPASVRLVNSAGESVSELPVPDQGTWAVNTSTGAVTFTPSKDFTGNPSPISYTVNDGAGNTVTAEITAIYLPTAADDASSNNTLNSPVTVDVIRNDSANIVARTVQLLGADGDPVDRLAVDGQGVWTVDTPTGKVTFTPDNGFTGNPAPVEYSAQDSAGNKTTASITVSYAPVAVNDASTGNRLGSAVTVDPTSNDSDNLTARSLRLVDSSGALVTTLAVTGEGEWKVDSTTGKLTFTPANDYTGDPDPVTYTIADGSGNTVTAMVSVGYLPAATKDTSTGNKLGSAVTINPTRNDSSNTDPSSVRLVDGAGKPVDKLSVAGEGVWSVDRSRGTVTFTPNRDFTGNATPVRYSVANSRGEIATATMTVAYAPDAADDVSSGNTAGQPVTIDIVRNDSTNLDPRSIRLIDGNGAPVTILVADGEGTWTVDTATGAITFTPQRGFTGTPSPVTYIGTDAYGDSVTATVSVNYLPTVITPAPADAPFPPAAAPVPDQPGIDKLAFTGAAVFWPSVGALTALLLGATLMVLRRRRAQD